MNYCFFVCSHLMATLPLFCVANVFEQDTLTLPVTNFLAICVLKRLKVNLANYLRLCA